MVREWGPSRHGHTFVIGKRMPDGKEDHRVISWNDPTTGSWEPSLETDAGNMVLPFSIPPDVEVIEDGDCIRFGSRVEFRYSGKPYIYGAFMLDEEGRRLDKERARLLGIDELIVKAMYPEE